MICLAWPLLIESFQVFAADVIMDTRDPVDLWRILVIEDYPWCSSCWISQEVSRNVWLTHHDLYLTDSKYDIRVHELYTNMSTGQWILTSYNSSPTSPAWYSCKRKIKVHYFSPKFPFIRLRLASGGIVVHNEGGVEDWWNISRIPSSQTMCS